MVRIKRAYEPRAPEDGYRVLVDRLWPRGLRKADANLDEWRKDVAPGEALRKWFQHDPSRWVEFQRRYRHELEGDAVRSELGALAQRARSETVTLVYAARDEEHNNAVVLQREIERRMARRQPTRGTSC
jgi:uncharacterized protein YeaO (DUF488 family)